MADSEVCVSSTDPDVFCVQGELDALQVIATLSSFTSIAYICFTLWTRRRSKEVSLPNKLIAYELTLNLMMCSVTVVGRCGDSCPEDFCQFQGFMVQFSGFASHLWMMFIAWKLYQWIAQRKNEERLRKKLPSTYGTILLLSFICALVVALAEKIGECSTWCWIGRGNNIAPWRVGANYAWLVGSWAFSIFVLVLVTRRKSVQNTRQGLESAVQNRLTLYIFLFLFCWFFSLLDVIVNYGINKTNLASSGSSSTSLRSRKFLFITAWLAALMTPLHGFFNCLTFNGHLDWAIPLFARVVQRLCFCQQSDEAADAQAPKKYVVRRASMQMSSVNNNNNSANEKKRSSVFDGINMFALYGGDRAPLGAPLSERDSRANRDGLASGRMSSFVMPGVSRLVPTAAPSVPSKAGGQSIGMTSLGRSAGLLGMGSYMPIRYSIFITTFNLGEAKIQAFHDSLADWIIRGHDIYSIGVQECLDLERVREAILTHLGGPDEYKMFCTEIGSDNTNLGYHGFIALTVFVRKADFDAGRVRETVRSTSAMATGKNLIITTAQNKGAVGIPFQIHDASVAFLASHLPSDQKGVCKLGKRNTAASTILKEVVLAPEDVDFDMHLQHDHVFFTGDLNYRMDPDAAQHTRDFNYMGAIIDACRIEKQLLGDDPQWLARKYSMLRSPKADDSMYPKEHERHLIRAAMNASTSSWMRILQADELRTVMTQGLAFAGFDEETPTFPPTYKRVKAEKGADGGCGDYTDVADMLKGFSHTGVEENDDEETVRDTTNSSSSSSVIPNSSPRPVLTSHQSEESLPGTAAASGSDANGISSSSSSSSSSSGDDGGGGNSGTAVGSDVPGDVEAPPAQGHGLIHAVSQMSHSTILSQLTHSHSVEHSPSFSTNLSVSSGKKPKRQDLRAPSYTDRILFHSLDDRIAKLNVVAYDFCDLVRCSDHRPVSMVCHLEVNASVIFPANFAQPLTLQETDKIVSAPTVMTLSHGREERVMQNVVGSGTFYLFELCITQLRVELNDVGTGGGAANAAGEGGGEEGELELEADEGDDASEGPKTVRNLGSLRGSGVVMHTTQARHGLNHGRSSDHGMTGHSNLAVINNPLMQSQFLTGKHSAASNSSKSNNDGLDRDSIPAAGELGHMDSSDKHEARRSQHSKLKHIKSYFSWLLSDDVNEHHSTNINTVEVVFPLPSKDPIGREKSTYKMAQALNIDEKKEEDLISSLKSTAVSASESLHRRDLNNQFEPLDPHSIMTPSVRFPFRPAPTIIPQWDSSSVQTCRGLRIVACVVPELGAHVLFKLLNKSDRELGQCVVTLSHLMVLDQKKQHRSEITNIPVTSGGRDMGEASGIFTLTFLASVSEEVRASTDGRPKPHTMVEEEP